MKVLYFAWLRERIGAGEEAVDPAGAETVAELVETLRGRGEGHALAFEDLAAVRVAVDMKVANWDAPIAGASEVAFFPPMTGG